MRTFGFIVFALAFLAVSGKTEPYMRYTGEYFVDASIYMVSGFIFYTVLDLFARIFLIYVRRHQLMVLNFDS